MDTSLISKTVEKEAGLVSTTINGKRFTINLLPASPGLIVFKQLTKFILPVFGVVLDNDETAFPGEDKFFTDLSYIIVNNLDDLDILNITKGILDKSAVDGKAIDFDTYFRGNFGELIQLMQFAIVENFKDAFTIFLQARGFDIQSLLQQVTLKPVSTNEQPSEQ